MKVSAGFKNFVRTIREISLGTILAFISVVIGILAILPKITDPRSLLLLILGTIIIILLYALLFILRKSFQYRFEKLDTNFEHHKNRLDALNHIIIDYFGYALQQNKYFKRSHHFVEEKIRLAHSLVEQLLPTIIKKIEEDHPPIKTIKIILDSGTTITPIFPCLIRNGVPADSKYSIELYTNNLAGIDEIHRFPPNEERKLSEDNFNLIGGQPLNQYRATTGDFTNEILKDLISKNDGVGQKAISVGIVTSNWFLTGRSHDEIQICARGRGHLEFKEILVNNCDYIILVAPLGKVLPVKDIDTFNSILKIDPEDKDNTYKGFTVPRDKRNQTYLHTSFRKSHSLSPLHRISDRLKDVKVEKTSENYIFSKACPLFDPKDDRDQAIRLDLPHDYIENNFKRIYGYDM